MTREELKEHCERQIQRFERAGKIMPVTLNDWKIYEEHKLILELLKQEPILDKIRAEIEHHRRKTQSIDPYDLVGDCLNIIDKYKAESESEE